ncbi:hypothetical protein H4R19_000788 [Coemansia spiralis]|nr:hypothetical protein H4R19_000788 [Coemansia spiralis]
MKGDAHTETETHPDASEEQVQRTTLFFSVLDQAGALDECLRALKASGISLTRIESRPSKSAERSYDVFVDIDTGAKEGVQKVVETIKKVKIVRDVRAFSSLDIPHAPSQPQVPWFPRKMTDLDTFTDNVQEIGDELPSDHPGANDPAYRRRRLEVMQKARAYRTGQPLPHVEYTDEENAAWRKVYTRLRNIQPQYACREFLHVFPLLEQNCGYVPERIPQIEDISQFLKGCTGFTLRPVMGPLVLRDFLNCLAFRVLHLTQFIRHRSDPYNSPEPDCCHEMLGHVAMFANPHFAELLHEIGLASLGASDEEIEQLATIFWFTAEYGLCREGANVRIFGASLLSSVDEIEYALTEAPETRPFDPSKTGLQKYPTTEFQPVYFVVDSLRDAAVKLREFSATLSRPFQVRYNPFTQSIEVLDSKDKVNHLARAIGSEMQLLTNALDQL